MDRYIPPQRRSRAQNSSTAIDSPPNTEDFSSPSSTVRRRYIPPQRRSRANSPPNTDDFSVPSNTVCRRLEELIPHGPIRSPGTYTLDEIRSHFGDTSRHCTLHDTVSRHGELSHIILFGKARLRWESDQVIFAHTNIDFLPGYREFKTSLEAKARSSNGGFGVKGKSASAGNAAARPRHGSPAGSAGRGGEKQAGTSESTRWGSIYHGLTKNVKQSVAVNSKDRSEKVIAVFAEHSRTKDPRNFVFTGYFRIQAIEFLKPGTAELIRMLKRKSPDPPRGSSSQKRQHHAARESEGWKREWAVIKLDKVEEEDVQPPEIEPLELELRLSEHGNLHALDGTHSGNEDIQESEDSTRLSFT